MIHRTVSWLVSNIQSNKSAKIRFKTFFNLFIYGWLAGWLEYVYVIGLQQHFRLNRLETLSLFYRYIQICSQCVGIIRLTVRNGISVLPCFLCKKTRHESKYKQTWTTLRMNIIRALHVRWKQHYLSVLIDDIKDRRYK